MPVGVYGHHSGQIGASGSLRIPGGFPFFTSEDHGADFSRAKVGILAQSFIRRGHWLATGD